VAGSRGLGLRGLYAEGYPLLECLQRQFNVLLKRYAGGVAFAYEQKAFSLKQLCAPWLFTLFCSSFPSKAGLRIWDYLVLQLATQFGQPPRRSTDSSHALAQLTNAPFARRPCPPPPRPSGSTDRTTPAVAVLAIACVAIIKQNRDDLMAWEVSTMKEFHNDVGMLLAESRLRDAYITEHFAPLARDKMVVESLRQVR
jgi:hypothetical protein